MKLKFLGTRLCSGVESTEKNNSEMASSAIVSESGIDILIDVSSDFSEQIKRFDIKKINAVLFTSANDISGINQLKEYLAGDSIIAVMERETFKAIKKQLKDVSFLQVRYFNPGQKFSISDMDIIPFKIKNSINKELSTVGFRINDVVYANNMELMNKEELIYFEKAKVIIINSSMLTNNSSMLDFAKQFSPKKLVITQSEQDDSILEIKENWKNNNGSADTELDLAYDGMEISTAKILKEQLARNTAGIHLSTPNVQRIYSGEKKLILKSEYYKNKIGKLFYLIENNKCYGIIKLLEPKKINSDGFLKLEKYHKINNSEKEMWWPYKKILYAYPFEILRKYETPREILSNFNVYNFSDEVKFLDTEETLIKNVTNYDPSKLSTVVLKDDFRILIDWYTTKRTGGEINHNIEVILDLATLVHNELNMRGIKFYPKEMKKYGKELFNRIEAI